MHFYGVTPPPEEGWRKEAYPYFMLESYPYSSLVPLFRWYHPSFKKYICGTQTQDPNAVNLGYISPTQIPGTIPLYGSYRIGAASALFDRYYTTSQTEVLIPLYRRINLNSPGVDATY